MYARQRIIVSDFEIDDIFDFFRCGTRLNTLFWRIEYDSVKGHYLPKYVNDNYFMRVK